MKEPIRPHPKNVDGPLYVEYGCCSDCDSPLQEAPSDFSCFCLKLPSVAPSSRINAFRGPLVFFRSSQLIRFIQSIRYSLKHTVQNLFN